MRDNTQIMELPISKENGKENLPTGFTVISMGILPGTRIAWKKFAYLGNPIDLPLISDGFENQRLLKLLELIKNSKKIYQECKGDLGSLIKSCEPYVEKGRKGIHVFIDNNLITEDSLLLRSDNIRGIMGIGSVEDEYANNIIDTMRANGVIQFDPHSIKEDNSLAAILLPFIHKMNQIDTINVKKQGEIKLTKN
ncbi:hypothetical protein K2X92_06315 [Candidatus Gracilibacteria bacterium]|nr:hypothetical protein [Candidatus Gracilibacteria bacterium]